MITKQHLPPKLEAVERGSNRAADLEADAYDRMSEGYQEMAKQVASLTLEELRRTSVPVLDIEDAVA
jgi:hypothetical protein